MVIPHVLLTAFYLTRRIYHPPQVPGPYPAPGEGLRLKTKSRLRRPSTHQWRQAVIVRLRRSRYLVAAARREALARTRTREGPVWQLPFRGDFPVLVLMEVTEFKSLSHELVLYP